VKKRKKRPPPLPRVTLLAFSRRDLIEFSEAVEALRGLVADLRLVAEQMPKPRAKRIRDTQPPAEPPTPALFQ